MKKLVQVLCWFFSYFLETKQDHFFSRRWIANISAFFILMSSCTLGCFAAYHHFSAGWGKTGTLCLLAAILFLTSLILYGISWLLKPKKNFSRDIILLLGQALYQIRQSNILKNVFSGVYFKVLAGVFLMILLIVWEKRHQKNAK
jgi:hypothetical protein